MPVAPPQPVVSHETGPHQHHEHPHPHSHHDAQKKHDHHSSKITTNNNTVDNDDKVPMLLGLSAGEATSTKAVKRDDDTESTISEHSDDIQPRQEAGTSAPWKSSPWSCLVCFDGMEKILEMNNFCGNILPATEETGALDKNTKEEEIPSKGEERNLSKMDIAEEAVMEATTPALADMEDDANEAEDKEPVLAPEENANNEVSTAGNKVSVEDNAVTNENIVLTHIIEKDAIQKSETKAPVVTVTLEPLNDFDVKVVRDSLSDRTSNGAPNVSMTMSMDRGESYTRHGSLRFHNLATGSFCDVVPKAPVIVKEADVSTSQLIAEEASEEKDALESKSPVEESIPTVIASDEVKGNEGGAPESSSADVEHVEADTVAAAAAAAAAAENSDIHDVASVASCDSESPEVKATKVLSLLVGVFDPYVRN